jgi:putative transposase
MSVRFVEKLSLSGIRASISSVGDAHDNALAGTTIGLYKPSAPGRTRRFAAAIQHP